MADVRQVCKALTRKGRGPPCRIPAADGSEYCFAHAHYGPPPIEICNSAGARERAGKERELCGQVVGETSECAGGGQENDNDSDLSVPLPRSAGVLVAIDDGIVCM